MKATVSAKFLNTKYNTVFEQNFNSYSEFNNFLIVNRQFVLLNVAYAN